MVVLLGLVSALAWGSGDFGGGLLSRRAPLLGVVWLTQVVGLVVALVVAIARGEPVPAAGDAALSVAAGVAGVIGLSALYQGLAVGRMAVVAPTTGVLAATVPVVAGLVLEAVPRPAVFVGIALALGAVVLVTRVPAEEATRPSGLRWALLAGGGVGLFNVFAGGLSSAGAFAPLVLIRLVQAVLLSVLIVGRRRPARLGRDVALRVCAVGVLDMTGNAAFILAAQAGSLAVAAVLSSLYPVVTVLLAIVVLREEVTRRHVAGVAATAAAIALIGLGSGSP